jgi:hypothetical protein
MFKKRENQAQYMYLFGDHLICVGYLCKQSGYNNRIAYKEFFNIASLHETFSPCLYRVANLSARC